MCEVCGSGGCFLCVWVCGLGGFVVLSVCVGYVCVWVFFVCVGSVCVGMWVGCFFCVCWFCVCVWVCGWLGVFPQTVLALRGSYGVEAIRSSLLGNWPREIFKLIGVPWFAGPFPRDSLRGVFARSRNEKVPKLNGAG